MAREKSVKKPSKSEVDQAVVFRAVRNQIAEAEEKLQTACSILRGGGFPENADALAGNLKRLRVWTQPQGWLSYLEKGGES